VCLAVQASQNLNLYEGRPHAVTLYLYPLSGGLGFQQMGVDDLLEGATPPGSVGPPVPIAVSPGERREIQETFPPMTDHVGVVADYYRSPGDPEGTRRLIVEAECGWGRPSIMLSPGDILLN
jgi:predicted component of type VI protein secretion system